MTETSTLVTTTPRSSQHPQPGTEDQRWPARRRWPKGRDESGLTTLEWLLIVAAVAGLAALAVVLVQNVVSDTSEQIAGIQRPAGGSQASCGRHRDARGSSDSHGRDTPPATPLPKSPTRRPHAEELSSIYRPKMSTTEDHLRGCS